MHGEEIHRATVRLVRTSLVSLHREPPREGSHGVALFLAVEVSEQSKRVPCPLDREIRVAFERREMRLAGPEHSEILCAWLRAEQSLGLLEVAACVGCGSVSQLRAGGEQVSSGKRERVVRRL